MQPLILTFIFIFFYRENIKIYSTGICNIAFKNTRSGELRTIFTKLVKIIHSFIFVNIMKLIINESCL